MSAGVLNHLVLGNLLFAAIVRDEPPPTPGTDHLGDDPLAAFQRPRRNCGRRSPRLACWTRSTRPRSGPARGGPGAVRAHVRVVEVLAHGWDMARATGQAADFPADVAERARAGAKKGSRGGPSDGFSGRSARKIQRRPVAGT